MSEFNGGAGGPSGNGRSYQNGTQTRAAAPPPVTQTSAPPQSAAPSGVRTPTDIMRQRRERDARKKAEQEAKEQQLQEEAEWKHKQQEQARQYQRQQQQKPQTQTQTQPQPQLQSQHAAGVAGESPSSQRKPGMTASRPPDMPLPEDPEIRQQHTRTQSAGVPQTTSRRPEAQPARQRTSTVPSSQPPQQQPPQSRVAGTSQQVDVQPESQTRAAPPTSGEQAQPQQQGKSRTGFPHAFERWEMLSSHWEGLTGYWIRRLEQNNEDLNREPLNQQMSRQITDLSAAGANLFHAVVELQRLRASSERKFQRWFFDTRAEQEKNQELRAELESQLKAERQARSEAVSATKQTENDKLKAEEMAREMRRELQISKEEARRAWEELGRREQEERERTTALRNGEPTIVGGVQVVPMMPGMPSRQTSTANRPSTRDGPYPGGPGATSMSGQDQREPTEQYMYETQVTSPSASDPFTAESTRARGQREADPFVVGAPRGKEASSRAPTMAAQTAPSSAQQSGESTRSPFYHHEGPLLHGVDARAPETDDGSYVPSTEGASSDIGADEYVSGRRDERTAYPPSISDDSDDYQEEHLEHGPRYGDEYGAGRPVSASEEIHSGYGQSVDYSGAGWGMGGTWDSVTPRHRHPTRLSDVLEEDERSRTSASRASQASRTVH